MVRSAVRFGFAIIAVVGLAACAAAPGTAPTPGPGAALAPAGPPVSMDQAFLDRAATGTVGEVELGRLAQQRAVTPRVRAFGAHIAAEHGRVHARLVAMAQRLGLVPNAGTPDVSRLAAVPGPEFDRLFVADQVTDHRQALGLFESEAATGRDPRLRGFAREWVPILRRDLQRAENLAARIGA